MPFPVSDHRQAVVNAGRSEVEKNNAAED